MFYNKEGNIVVQQNDIDADVLSIVSDASNMSSGNHRRSYRSRKRHEKKKKRHGPKGGRVKSIKWWGDKKPINSFEELSLPTHTPPLIPS